MDGNSCGMLLNTERAYKRQGHAPTEVLCWLFLSKPKRRTTTVVATTVEKNWAWFIQATN